MRIGRLILVVATLVTILVFPLLIKDAVQALRLPSAYAAPSFFDPGGRVYQNGNNNPNNDDDDGDQNNDNDDESDNEGEDEDNDNVECFANLNSNEEVPCDFEDNDNDAVYYPPTNDNGGGSYTPPPAPSGGTGASVDRCFSASETGGLFLDAPDFDVTITVVNALGSDTRLSLLTVDPASVPAAPTGATLLDSAVWNLDARVGCDGGGVGMLPAAVNNGFAYSISANKAKLQIVRLENGAWVEVTTVPDPSKSYISATIQNAGTYAVIQKP